MSNQPLFYGQCSVCDIRYKTVEDYEAHKGVHDKFLKFFDNVVPLDMDMIRRYAIIGEQLPYKKLFILGDEWQQVMDARRSMDGDELINTYFIMQTRKRGIILDYCTSLRGMSELRLRDNTNIIIKCYKRHKKGGAICYTDWCLNPHYCEWYIINVAAGKGVHRYFKNPELIFPMYDTNYIISPISHLSEKDMHEITSAIRKSIGSMGEI
jgi:hypothetical protein